MMSLAYHKRSVTAVMIKRDLLTDLRGYESKLSLVQEQAWERHGVQGWLGLREIAVMHF